MEKIRVVLKKDSPNSGYGYYVRGDKGYVVDFVSSCAVIILDNGKFAKAELNDIERIDEMGGKEMSREEMKQVLGHEPLSLEQMKEIQAMQLQHDWEDLRNQAAVSAMQGMLSNNDMMHAAVCAADETMSVQVVVARNAIAYANALLHELKGA